MKAGTKHEGSGLMRSTNQETDTSSSDKTDLRSLEDQLVGLQKLLEAMAKQTNQPRTGSYPTTPKQRETNRIVPYQARTRLKQTCYERGSENYLKRDCPNKYCS